MSKVAAQHLIESLVEEGVELDHNTHRIQVIGSYQTTRKERFEREHDFLDDRAAGKPTVKWMDKR